MNSNTKTLSQLINAAPKVKHNGMLVRVLLSFLATAGLFYVNIMPALVEGLKHALNFSNQQAGLIGSANVYGAAAGALSIVFFVQKLPWKVSSFYLLLGLISIDLVSMLITQVELLTLVRFIHGFVGGSLVGIGFAIIAKTQQPDRTFGMLLLVQFGFGGLAMMYVPELVESFGVVVLYITLISFSLATLLMLPFIPEFEKLQTKTFTASAWSLLKQKPLFLTLLSIFLFQAANMGLYAFVVGLGKFYGLGIGFISISLGWAAWIGIVGSLLVIVLSTKFGLIKPLVLGISLTAFGTWALIYSGNSTIWIIANLGVGITWAFVIPYLFGMSAQLDFNGQVAAMAGLASKLGLATGPVVTGFLLGDNNYAFAIMVATVVLIFCMFTSIMAAKQINKISQPEVAPPQNTE